VRFVASKIFSAELSLFISAKPELNNRIPITRQLDALMAHTTIFLSSRKLSNRPHMSRHHAYSCQLAAFYGPDDKDIALDVDIEFCCFFV